MNTITDDKILATVALTLPGQAGCVQAQAFVNSLSMLAPGDIKFCVVSWPSGISGVMPFPAHMDSPPPDVIVAFFRAALAAPPGAVGPLELKGVAPFSKRKGVEK